MRTGLEGMRSCRWLAAVMAAGLLLAACGGGDDAGPGIAEQAGDDGGGDGSDASGSDENTDVCALLSDEETRELLGGSFAPEPTDDGPFPGCSWGTGRLIVQVDADATGLVLPPGQECPEVDVGDEAVRCPGALQFLVGGTRVRVSTIEEVSGDTLLRVAEILEQRI